VKARKIVIGIGVVVCACSAPDAPLPVTGTVTSAVTLARVDLGTLGGASSVAADIDNQGVVVGSSQLASGATHAFRWSAASGMIDLGTLPGDVESQAVAILDSAMPDDGQILGFSGGSGRWTPVVWSSSGASRALPIPLLPNATFGRPTAFNTLGQVVGWDVTNMQHAWVWSASTGKYDLTANVPGGSPEGAATAIMPSGLVLLTTRAKSCNATFECWRTYQWTASNGYLTLGTPDDDGEVAVAGLGANESGTVVGWFARSSVGTTAYRWSPAAGFSLLPHYSGDGFRTGYATAVNAAGTIVGAESDPATGRYVATAWPTTGGISRLSPDDPSSSVAVAINGMGSIAGWVATSEIATHAVVWTDQPSVVASRTSKVPTALAASAASGCLAALGGAITRQELTTCLGSGSGLRARVTR
jgi:probable HAF family extracellular repeat protein